MLFTKLSVVLMAAMAAVGEASHKYNALHPKRAISYNSSVPAGQPTTTIYSSVTVIPVPIGTGVSGPAGAAPTGTDVTLTYTLGTGISTVVVTTTIHRTATQTTYVTGTPEAPNAVQQHATTTTISLTSTATQTVKILPATSAVSGSSSGAVGDSGSGSCAGQATVTVTEKETVTVTATPTSAAGGINSLTGLNTQVVEPAGATTTTATFKLPPAPSSPASVPFSNGTAPFSKPASSGFLTSKLPLPTGRRHL